MRKLNSSLRGKSSAPEKRTHAIVIGGSIGGMAAATVLARYFDSVTILERDSSTFDHTDGNLRSGVPHARHLHALLARGMQIFEDFFPGFKDELAAQGATHIEAGSEFRTLYESGWSPGVATGLETCACTRGLLEATIRRRLVGNPKINFVRGCEVTGLALAADNESISGVHLRRRGGASAAGAHEPNSLCEESPIGELQGDLVVDASGRHSHAPRWLEALGFPVPEETVIDAGWGYATRIYERPAEFPADWKQLLVMYRPPHLSRAGVLQPIEGGRWLITLAGVMRDYPPTDDAGFLNFVRSLPTPLLYDTIKAARPLTPAYAFRHTENRLRHYNKLARFPERFIVIGDALCAFNPIYGQGMTICALTAQLLDSMLRERIVRRKARRHEPPTHGQEAGVHAPRLDGFSRRFQERLRNTINPAWTMAIGADLRWTCAPDGKLSRGTRFMHWYVAALQRLIPDSPQIFKRYQQVAHLMKPPVALFHPAIWLRVLASRLRVSISPRSSETINREARLA